MTAQLLDITADEYFALDAFSQSAAKTLITKSPLHARAGYRKIPTKRMERGDVIGRLLLGKGKDYEVLHHDSYNTKAAKADRDAARAAGRVPVLADDFEDHKKAAELIRAKLADRGVVLDGVSEQQITWVEHTEFGDVVCKGMFDHVWIDRGMILDLKVTEDASPAFVERNAENLGYGIQWAAYTRALEQLKPEFAGKVGMAFAFCEPDEPHAMNLAEPGGAFAELGMRRWLRAVREWARCTKENDWPSYGSGVNTITVPPWALARESASVDER
jgi:hypothetical protein